MSCSSPSWLYFRLTVLLSLLSLCSLAASAQQARINIVGEVVRPGTYSVPVRSQMSDVLRTAGGPTPYGSVRHVRVIRNGTALYVHDLYAERADTPQTRRPFFRNGDIVLVEIADLHVCVSGLVKRPGRYVLTENETLADLLRYCGGLADTEEGLIIQLHRSEHGLMTLSDVMGTPFSDVRLLDGDSISLQPIVRQRRNEIIISGAVKRPGRYEWDSTATLLSALDNADGPTEEARPDHILIHRRGRHYERVMESVNLSDAGGKDFPLCAEDSVVVPLADAAGARRTVKVSGGVFRPGTYAYESRMTVADLLTLAGGLRPDAACTRLLLTRPLSPDAPSHADTLASALQIPLNGSLARITLHPFDEVSVLTATEGKMRGSICILGAVNFGGRHAWHPFLTVEQAIENAGGLSAEAYYSPAIVRHGRIVPAPSSADDFLLMEGDTLVIPFTPAFVNVTGEVQRQTVQVPYRENASLKYYLSQAGGTNAVASKSHIYGVTINNRALKIRRRTRIPPGTTIVVPRKGPARDTRLSIKDLQAAIIHTLLIASRIIHF